jgi:hypothetical protein
VKKVTKELIQRLFLYIDWNGRQSVKSSVSPKEREKLYEALGGEPNW